jgi:hypothetical protein
VDLRGLIVQVAWSGRTDAEVNDLMGFAPEPPPDDGAVLIGPVLGHPDPVAAAATWEILGGKAVQQVDGSVEIHWDGAPLTVRIVEAGQAGPVGLQFADALPLPQEPASGAAVLVD